jgi:hypothetical protein
MRFGRTTMSKSEALLVMFLLGAFGVPIIVAFCEIGICVGPRTARVVRWLGIALATLLIYPGLMHIWVIGVMS